MSSNTRSESALVRPFAGIDSAEIPLEAVRLKVGDVEHEPGSVVLTEDELATAAFALILPEPADVREAIEDSVLNVVDCGLIVLATGRSHRISKVILHEYSRLADYPTELVITRTDADLIFNDRAGFTLTVAIVLLADLTPMPLQPHMAGTWLARRDFRLSPEADETSFSPEELTPAIRDHFGLPAKTLRYVHVEGLLDEDDLSEAVHVYVDPEVLKLLLANPSEASAMQMQTELAVQATETVAVALTREIVSGGADEPTPDELNAYPAPLRFFENLARTLGTDVAGALSLTAEPNRLRAFLEDAFDLRGASATALKEK